MIITAVRSFCFLLFCFLSYSKFFIRKWTIYFIFFLGKFFFLLDYILIMMMENLKKKKKEKQRAILRQSYRILSRVRCLFVLRLKKYKHIKPP